MTIYFAGHEHDVTSGGAVVTGYHDGNYSRCGIQVKNRYYQMNAYCHTEFGANAETGWWAHCYAYHYGQGTYQAIEYDGNLMVFYNAANAAACVVHCLDAGLRITVYNSAGASAVASAGRNITYRGANLYDVHCYTTAGGVCTAELFLDGVLVATASLSGSNRGLKRGFYDYPFTATYVTGDDQSNWAVFSELIYADEDTRGMRVKTIPPTGNGAETAWIGTYADVDESSTDTASILTTEAAAIETFAHSTTLAEGTPIKALCLGALSACAASDGIEAVLRLDSVNYSQDLLKALVAGENPNHSLWQVNPATSAAFTASEVNALQFGFKNVQTE